MYILDAFLLDIKETAFIFLLTFNMKTKLVISALAFVLISYSCGNKKNPTESESNQSLSEMLKENPAYDASKINPSAEVVNIKLKAQGNSMADMHYDLKEIHVPAGSTVKLEFINEGTDVSMQHNFVLIETGSADSVAKAGLVAGADMNYVPKMPEVLVSANVLLPGTKTEIIFPAPGKGEYDFICTYPGHYLKMNGKLFVD